MRIIDLCRREIVAIDQGASLQAAAQKMRDEHVGALLVTATRGPQTRAVGLVTDRDLVTGAMAAGADAARTAVGALVAGEVLSVPAEATPDEAIALMQQAGVRRLLVADGAHRVAGLVSFDDLLVASARQLLGLAGAVREGLRREHAAAQDTEHAAPAAAHGPAAAPPQESEASSPAPAASPTPAAHLARWTQPAGQPPFGFPIGLPIG